MLTDEQKSFFMDMESMFNSAGWQRLHQGWQQEMKQLPESAFFNARSMEDMLSDRVRMQLLTELVNLPQSIQRMKDEIISSATIEAEDDE